MTRMLCADFSPGYDHLFLLKHIFLKFVILKVGNIDLVNNTVWKKKKSRNMNSFAESVWYTAKSWYS